MKLREQFDGQFQNNLFRPDGGVQYTYGADGAERKQIDENDQQLSAHIQKQNQRRIKSPLLSPQDQDCLTIRRESQYNKLFKTFPEVEIKSSIEGAEIVHAAALGMQLSSDCRSMQSFKLSSEADPMAGFSTNTVRYNSNIEQQEPTAQVNEATSVMQDRLGSLSTTKQFSYCGRPRQFGPAKDALVKALSLNLKDCASINIDFARVVQKTLDMQPLDLEASVLQRPC